MSRSREGSEPFCSARPLPCPTPPAGAGPWLVQQARQSYIRSGLRTTQGYFGQEGRAVATWFSGPAERPGLVLFIKGRASTKGAGV